MGPQDQAANKYDIGDISFVKNSLTRNTKLTFFNSRTSTKLGEIENLLPAWKMLESRLEQLQKDLKEDGKTLHLLDTILTNGQFTDQTATCVRDVAKVLSESTSYQVRLAFFEVTSVFSIRKGNSLFTRKC